MVINKGDTFLCIKDVVMNKSGRILYYAGKVYKSEMVDCITNESGMIDHKWYAEDNPQEHFKKISMTNVEKFKQIASELGELYEKKNKCYGNSFSNTYQKLGIVTAIGRISDKYERLCTLVKNPDIDDLGESIEDTLRDMAAYCIMTLIELRK